MLGRLRRHGRRSLDRGAERRIEVLERRIAELEDLVEGLQDAVHREGVRRDERTAQLERKTDPQEMARALSADARRRGL